MSGLPELLTLQHSLSGIGVGADGSETPALDASSAIPAVTTDTVQVCLEWLENNGYYDMPIMVNHYIKMHPHTSILPKH